MTFKLEESQFSKQRKKEKKRKDRFCSEFRLINSKSRGKKRKEKKRKEKKRKEKKG